MILNDNLDIVMISKCVVLYPSGPAYDGSEA